MAFIVGEVTAPVTADPTQFENAMAMVKAQGEKAAGSIMSKFETIGKSFQNTGKSLIKYITLPVAGLAGVAIKIGMDFEQSMSTVKALSGATSQEMAVLEGAARDAGAATSKSAKEAADALGYMALAGWDVETSISGLMPVLRLSEAGNIDLARASSLVTDSMSAMGIEVKDLDHYLDIVAQTARSSNTDIDQMAEAYLGVGGTLRGLRVPLDESALALGFLANAGVKGGEAGNALNAVLLNLTSPMGRAKNALKDLNFNAFDSQGKFKGLENVLFELKDKMADMTEEQRQTTIAMIGGKEHVKDLNALLNGLDSSYDSLKQSISEADGALNEMAETMLENAKGDIIILISALGELALKVYDMLRPIIVEIIAKIQDFVDWLNDLNPAAQQAALGVALVAASLGPFLYVLGILLSQLPKVTLAIEAIGKSVTALGKTFTWLTTNPVGLVITAIGILVAAGVLIYKNWDTIKEKAIELGKVISPVWDRIRNGVIVTASAIAGLLLPKFTILAAQATVTAAKTIAAWGSSAASATASAAVQALASLKVIGSWVATAASATVNAAIMAASWVVAMGPVAWVIAGIAAVASAVAIKTGAMAKAIDWLKEKFVAAFNAIIKIFNKLTEALGITQRVAKSQADLNKGFRELESAAAGPANINRQFREMELGLKLAGESLDDTIPIVDDFGESLSGVGDKATEAGGKSAEAAEKTKTAWVGTADSAKAALDLLRTQHETEMTYAEMTGDKVESLRLKHQQLNDELVLQRSVVEASWREVEKANKAGILQGETKQDLIKRIDELNRKLADEYKAQASLEKQIQETSESIKTQGRDAKELVNELKKVAQAYHTDLANALEDYNKNVQNTNENLARDVADLQAELSLRLNEIQAQGMSREKQVTQQFQQELDNRAKALMNFVGLFDEVSHKEVSGEKLLENLEGQVDAFDDWQENIQKLAAKGIDEGLLEELRSMGPKAGAEIAALNTLTSEQLTQYVNLWKKKQAQAKDEAVIQLAKQREEMNRQLNDIRNDTAQQMDQQRREVARKLEEMNAKAQEELEKYKLEWEKKNEEIRKNTEKNIKDIHQKFNDLVGKSTNYGVSLMENFMSGIDSMMPALISKLESIADTIDSYMPHSPARRGPLKRITEWGPSLMGELIKGIEIQIPQLRGIIEKATEGIAMGFLSPPGMLSPAMAANGFFGGTSSYGDTIFQPGSIVIHGAGNAEDIFSVFEREMFKRGVRF